MPCRYRSVGFLSEEDPFEDVEESLYPQLVLPFPSPAAVDYRFVETLGLLFPDLPLRLRIIPSLTPV